jgi:Uma2 family endonuclease
MSTIAAPGPSASTTAGISGAWRNVRKRWTIDEFHEIYSLPRFESKRLALLDGEILEMPNPNAPHDTGLGLALAALTAIFGAGFWVRGQMALRLSQVTDPMPDVAVVPGTPRDYPQQPTTALLVVEVSDSTLGIDTGVKAHLYAKAGIADYWVVDLNNRRLIVHRDPRSMPNAPFGSVYGTINSLSPSELVTPVAAPQSSIRVTDLLP